MGASTNIIQAEGPLPGKMSIFVAIRAIAAICSRARASQPDMDTLHRPPVSGAGRGGTVGEQTWEFLANTEGQGVLR
jgi:hypothetical protein